ncbi:MAG TPA: cytidine/deoxycytidylate deaminase family protein [Armatimonadota bacterium]|nr:cytidine/deoxycytidylate deaminase family protein [Armatimonadota bacterium]
MTHAGSGQGRSRPGWDEYFLEIAQVVAKRSTCLRRQIGAVIVRDRRILTTGYNGAPSGLAHCAEIGCLRDQLAIPSGTRHEACRALHSEMNAIIQAAQHGVSTKGGTLYCTSQPCSVCARMLINAGIVRIVYTGDYPDEFAASLLQEAGIEVVRFAGLGKTKDKASEVLVR